MCMYLHLLGQQLSFLFDGHCFFVGRILLGYSVVRYVVINSWLVGR